MMAGRACRPPGRRSRWTTTTPWTTDRTPRPPGTTTSMPSTIRHLTIDCRDPYPLAVFWSAALGFIDEPDNPNAPDDPEALIVDPRGLHPGLLFIPVPEAKAIKNR